MIEFEKIKRYEFTPRIDANIFNGRHGKWEISIEKINSDNEITIVFEGKGFEAHSEGISFSVEQIEDLITKYKEHKKNFE